MRRRHQKTKQPHFCLVVNKAAGGYDRALLRRLTGRIRKAGGYYTVLEPDSPRHTLRMARRAAGTSRSRQAYPPTVAKRGRITSLVACGGDGTFNLVARAALRSEMPIGLLPMGRQNNIARSLCGRMDPDLAIEAIVRQRFRPIDTGDVAGLPFFGSLSMGLLTELTRTLAQRKPPRFGIGWSRLIKQLATEMKRRRMIVKADAFRFEIQPYLLSINVMAYTAGLCLSPLSTEDDGQMEVIFDVADEPDKIGAYAKQIYKQIYTYGSDVRLYRSATVSLYPVRGQTLCLDGELITLPTNSVEIKLGTERLKVFC